MCRHFGVRHALVVSKRKALPMRRIERLHTTADRHRIGRLCQQLQRAGSLVLDVNRVAFSG